MNLNGTNTNFTNGLEASKFLNVPQVTSPIQSNLKAGALNMFPTNKLGLWSGTAWGNLALESWVTSGFKASTYVPSWSEITSKPTTLSGYGITDATSSARALTINGVTQSLAADRTWTVTDITGNSGTATKLQTARTINGTSFDGSANITIIDSTKEPAITAGTTSQYWRGDKSWQTLNTAAVAELTNLYWTQARFDTAFTGKSTTNLAEGINLYYTEARVTANAANAANTAARHNAVTLGTANGLSLSTQQLSLGLASSGVTGALSGTDWNTFNGKQNALGYTPYNATNPAGYTANTGTVTNLTATNGTGQTWSISNPTTTPNISLALTSSAVGLGAVENKSSATIRSEITSGNVTGALGYTPYNSSNPAGYITGFTETDPLSVHIGSDYQEITGYKRFKGDIGADRAIFMGSAANDNPAIGNVIQMSNTNDAATTTGGYAIQLGTGSDLIFNSYSGSPGSISYVPQIRIKNGGTMVYVSDPTAKSDFTSNDNAIPSKKYVKSTILERVGVTFTVVASGNGSTTTFSFAHGITGYSGYVFSVLASANTPPASNFQYVYADNTNVTIVYTVAPPAGTQNMLLSFTVCPSYLG